MRSLSRVVWSEGMYLSPHHFQTQARHFENALHFAASALRSAGWGLTALELDTEAITNGIVSVRLASGLLADGLVFDIPSSDPPPPTLDIRDLFSPVADAHIVSLTISSRVSSTDEFARTLASATRRPRYVSEAHLVPDELNPQDETQVDLGRRNFQLMLETEAPGDVVQLPLARVRRIGAGKFTYDTTFIPPILQVGASEYLITMLHRLCVLMEEKATAAADVRAGDARSIADQFRKDAVNFWYLHTLYSNMPPLRHFLLTRTRHPEDLYVQMLQLAGGLSCFLPQADVKALPSYDHEDLGECFDALDTRIRQWLHLMIPSPCISTLR